MILLEVANPRHHVTNHHARNRPRATNSGQRFPPRLIIGTSDASRSFLASMAPGGAPILDVVACDRSAEGDHPILPTVDASDIDDL
jgi:hypothetical protein